MRKNEIPQNFTLSRISWGTPWNSRKFYERVQKKDSYLLSFESGKRGSNSRPQPWQGCALPTELFPHSILTGAKIKAFTLMAKFCTRFFISTKQRDGYLPNKAFSASSIIWKLKPFTTSFIKASIRSLQRLPILPAWVWFTCLLWVNLPASMSRPTFL